jgi:hypothetical protein
MPSVTLKARGLKDGTYIACVLGEKAAIMKHDAHTAMRAIGNKAPPLKVSLCET